jgi:hypothetical protein
MGTHLHSAIYARVSSEQQAKEHTIASQIDALKRRIADDALECNPELCFVDDGYSGSSLVWPGLERLRDQAAAGTIDRLYVLSPDRLSRKYAYQTLVVEELARCGVEIIFLNTPIGKDPEKNLLLQVQGMIAEYERAKYNGTQSARQAICRSSRISLCAGGGSLWVPLHQQARRRWRGTLSSRGQSGASGPENLQVGWSGAMFDRGGPTALVAGGHPHADRKSGLGPRNDLGDPQEPRVQGNCQIR